MEDNRCPFTGLPCHHPKVVHVTDVSNLEATKVYHLCQICAGKIHKVQPAPPPKQEQPAPQQSVLPPLIKGIFDLLALAMQDKIKNMAALPMQPIAPPMKPPCPACGTSLQDIAKTSRLGCAYCYDHYKEELMPVFIAAHKATQHVGKHPKHKGPCPEELPLEEQLKVLELQLKSAVEQEKYELAGEIKNKIAVLKQTLA